MKSKGARSSVSSVSENKIVQAEMQSFLEALASYPERFATDPELTFEQHRTSLAISAVIEISTTRDKRARSAAASS